MTTSDISQIYITLGDSATPINYADGFNTPRNELYRGVSNSGRSFRLNIPHWFTHDPRHDYIIKPGHKGYKFTVKKPIKLVNLQNVIVRNVLNVAIDRLTKDEVHKIPQFYNPGGKLSELSLITTADQLRTLKQRLKSVYGGISFIEQVDVIEGQSFNERVARTKILQKFLKDFKTEHGLRYSLDKYDNILCFLITSVFPQKYMFFKGVCGWYHKEWQTAWHDKYEDGSMMFKTEVAMVVNSADIMNPDEGSEFTPNFPGGSLTRKNLKRHSSRKKNAMANKDDRNPTGIRHPSRAEPKPHLQRCDKACSKCKGPMPCRRHRKSQLPTIS
jgi:hypothetical protein